MAHIQGVDTRAGHHPFHCWSLRVVHVADTLLVRKPEDLNNGQKTLEWPTIIGGFDILTVLRIELFLTFQERSDARMVPFLTFWTV